MRWVAVALMLGDAPSRMSVMVKRLKVIVALPAPTNGSKASSKRRLNSPNETPTQRF
jgi:hypothetical protein